MTGWQCCNVALAIPVLLTACCVGVVAGREWRSKCRRHALGSPYSAGVSQRWALVVTDGLSMVHGDDSMWPGLTLHGQLASRRVLGGYSCIRHAASCVASDRPAAFCMAGSRLARSIAWALHSSPVIGRMLLQLRFSKTHGLVVKVSSTTSEVGGSTLGGRYFGSHAEPWRLASIPGWSHLGYLFCCCLWRDAPEICMRDIYLRDAARGVAVGCTAPHCARAREAWRCTVHCAYAPFAPAARLVRVLQSFGGSHVWPMRHRAQAAGVCPYTRLDSRARVPSDPRVRLYMAKCGDAYWTARALCVRPVCACLAPRARAAVIRWVARLADASPSPGSGRVSIHTPRLQGLCTT